MHTRSTCRYTANTQRRRVIFASAKDYTLPQNLGCVAARGSCCQRRSRWSRHASLSDTNDSTAYQLSAHHNPKDTRERVSTYLAGTRAGKGTAGPWPARPLNQPHHPPRTCSTSCSTSLRCPTPKASGAARLSHRVAAPRRCRQCQCRPPRRHRRFSGSPGVV